MAAESIEMIVQSLPASSPRNEFLFSIDERMECLASRIEIRTQSLGEYAKITTSGFIDTENGYTVTPALYMDLALKKIEEDRKIRTP